MGALLVVATLGVVLTLVAVGGPWLLKHAAPALAVAPRFASLAVTLTALIWIGAFLALGPVVGWVSRGPAWLPEGVAAVCQRCLAAATPFQDPLIQVAIPAIVPLVVPLIGVAAVGVGLRREWRQRVGSRRHLSAWVHEAARKETVLGHRAYVIDDDARYAFSLPRSSGGIVISSSAIESLSPVELVAVLHHEEAHIWQRHHLLIALLNGITRYFRWVPLIRTVRDAVPHYLEIAADHVAKREIGTTALAGALLKLGAPAAMNGTLLHPPGVVLHAAGTERIRHLIGAPKPRASVALAVLSGLFVLILFTATISVNTPYWLALASGC